MSIPVALDDLARTLSGYGPGYLLSVPGDPGAGPKAVTIEPEVTGGGLRLVGPGRGSLANVSARAAVTLLFPPPEPHGYSLIVDGTAVAEGEDVQVSPTGAVLHRPAHHAPQSGAEHDHGAGGCGHDCGPVS